jgi:hypothetical protein
MYLSPPCVDDGKRNLQEGLISKRHAEAIQMTNDLLEEHQLQMLETRDEEVFQHLYSRQSPEIMHSMGKENEAARK